MRVKGRSQAARTAPNNDDVDGVRPRAGRKGFGHMFDGLARLFEGIANESHTAEFADHVDLVYIGLIGFANLRNIDAPFVRAEHEGNGFDRTGTLAQSMSDATSGAYGNSNPMSESENILFRTDSRACARANTRCRVNERV